MRNQGIQCRHKNRVRGSGCVIDRKPWSPCLGLPFYCPEIWRPLQRRRGLLKVSLSCRGEKLRFSSEARVFPRVRFSRASGALGGRDSVQIWGAPAASLGRPRGEWLGPISESSATRADQPVGGL